MNRKTRVQNLSNAICPSARTDAANSHAQGIGDVSRIIGKHFDQKTYDNAYHSFLSGWDAAMELDRDELLDENQQLHGMVIDLCARLMLRRCEHCQGHGLILGTLDECPHCDRGYVDVPAGEAERVVDEIRGEDERCP